MLIQFNFKNYKSFRDETILDLSATKITEYSEHVISEGNEKILPAAAIFGANAHGKSNVLDAFIYMHMFVIRSLHFSDGNDTKGSDDEFQEPTPFLFDPMSKDEPSSFEVYFIDPEDKGSRTYNYGFTVGKDGVMEEWLNYKAKTSRNAYRRIFYRNTSENEIDLSGLPSKSRENIEVALESNTLIVSLGAKLKIDKLKHIREWFLKNEFADFGEPLINYVLSRQLPDRFVDDKSIQEKVVRFFSTFDDHIKGFNIESIPDKDDKKKYSIKTIHKIVGSDETVSIPLENESAGTLKMFALFSMLQKVLDNGSVLIIDELNSRLHPLLVRALLITFINPEINDKHAQIVFTSHDTWQLTGNGLRRDEIWFTEKDANGVCSLYSLADFVDEDGSKIRKDENYEKNYLLGKYGAIPSMKCFDTFQENISGEK